jgi:hypothetical protein
MRMGLFERYAFLTVAVVLQAPAQVGADETAPRATALAARSRSTAAPEIESVAVGSGRACVPSPDGSSGFTGSVRAPLFIDRVWTRAGQIWFGDVLFGPIGHIDVPAGVSVTGRFSSGFWPIDTVQVVGSSISFRSGRGRSGAIHLHGPDVALRQSDSLPAGTYLVAVTGTPSGLVFRASNGVSVEVAVFPPRSCDEPDGRAQVLEEGEFPDQTCPSHFARIWADGGRCINIACANRGGSSHVEAVANSVAEVECARYCERFKCTYMYKFTPCLRAGCGRNLNCPNECPNLDFCQASTPEDDPPKFNCFCFSRPDAGT